jgi:hypothetical protein
MALLRPLTGLALTLAAMVCAAQNLLLVPLDSRPAAGQFPQLIGDIASSEVAIPPMAMLGRFTTPGRPEEIRSWLLSRNFSNVTAVLASTDMLAYGGLIASRVPDVDEATAIGRLQVLRDIRRLYPKLPIYAFSALMRTAPTATRETKAWRMKLARYVELSDRLRRTGEAHLPAQLAALKKSIPKGQLELYLTARRRNVAVHEALIRMTKEGTINYLIIGADDAQKYGPHVPETEQLRQLVRRLAIDGSVFFCEGVDQHANLLVSRALLKAAGWTPQVYVRLSDPKAAAKPATYESQPLSTSIRDQIIASGARPTTKPESADYVMYLNAPGTDTREFRSFAFSLTQDVERSLAVAVADINFDKNGGSDSRLITELWRQQQAGNLLAFAGWNTAGNTIGTAVPHANVYLLAKRLKSSGLRRELAQRVFLLHRLVNDYGYHKYVRPVAYQIADDEPGATREEAYGEAFINLQRWVARNTKALVEKYYKDQFEGRRFQADGTAYQISAIRNIAVTLPWPRAFEVRIEFKFEVTPQ